MTDYGASSEVCYIEGYNRLNSTTDKVYFGVNKVTTDGKRAVKGIPIPVSFSNWNSTDPLQKVIDLKRDTEQYQFEGCILSDSGGSDDAFNKRNVCRSIFINGGTITVKYRNLTLTGVVIDYKFEDDANRSDKGSGLPQTIIMNFTLLIGVNI